MAANNSLMTYTEYEKVLDPKGKQVMKKKIKQIMILEKEKVEQHLTLVQNSKARRGSFTSHAFPELHNKVFSDLNKILTRIHLKNI